MSLQKLHNCFGVLSLFIMMGCAHQAKESEKYPFFDAAYDDHNRAPAKMSPRMPAADSVEGTLDPTYMRSQADYFFALGEAQSYDGQHQKAIESFKMVQVYDQNSSTVPLRLSAEYVKVGSMTQAFEQAELAVSKNPKSVDAKLMLGGLYSTVKAYDKALIHYEEALRLQPKNTEVPLYIGAVYAEKKQYDKAIKYFESLLKNEDYQTPHLAHYYIARIQTEQEGKPFSRAAERSFKKALEIKPDHAESVLGLGQLYTKLGMNEKAIALYKVYQKEHGPNAKVADILAPLYLEQEQFDLAYEQLEILESASEDSLNIKMRMALILIEQKKYQQAVQKLNQVLVQVPDSDKIIFYLAAIYEEMGQSTKAIDYFGKIPSESQFFGESIVHSAYLLKQQKKSSDALKIVKHSLDQRKDIPQLYAVYASLLEEKGDFQVALDSLRFAVEKFPEHVQLRFFLGTVHDKLGNKKDVIENMKKVIEMDPNHVQGLNYLSYTFTEMNESLDEAETYVQRALKLEPKDAYVMDTYGWVLFKKGKTTDSIKMLEAAYRNQPTESVIAEHLGDAYFKADMVERARSMYEKAVEYENDEKKAEKLKQKITSIKKQIFPKGERLPASIQNP